MQLVGAWQPLKTVKEFASQHDDGHQVSAGFVFKETKKWLTLYGSRPAKVTAETNSHNEVHKIPKSAIVEITELVAKK